ncbi:MAG TPA: glycine zipper family protein [Thermoanaerobaculia bacterium]|nr:glycine zipper family protein [Thermoanaerobaculia bacterium]
MSARKKIQAAVLGVTLLMPASGAFAATRHHHVVRHVHHHYSRTRGTVVGAAAGALIDHKHPVTGAIIGAGVGNAVQYERNKRH